MGHPTAEQLAQRAFDLGLLNERQLQQAWAELGTRNAKVKELLKVFLRREFLTNYQVERLVKGDRSGFFFGDYKVLYLVGSGTFARVYRAVHRGTEQVVALKVLRSRFSENPEQYSLFVREGEVGKSLRHPNIVPIYDVVSKGHDHVLVMEFIEGRNLREFVKVRGRLSPIDAVPLTIGISRGLQYAFERGLTHRDLKMNNVLVSSRGEAKLVDFGLAAMDEALADDTGADQPNARAIDYAALERATGVRRDDTRSDIYFLGCIFYHMLTGVPPLSESRDRLQRLNKTRFLEVMPVQKVDASIPNHVGIIVNRAMSLNPSRRYQSPAEMLRDLESVAKRLEHEPPPPAGATTAAPAEATSQLPPPDPQYSVMVVESNADLQNIFRSGFRKAGYRVLLTSDPARALQRFRQDASTADCVLFSAQELGHGALEAFNQLATDPKTQLIPSALLLGEEHRSWAEEAQTDDRRMVLQMPITMKNLRAALARLTGNSATPSA